MSALPASAEPNDLLGPQEGADLGSGLTTGETLLYFVGAPFGFVFLIAFIWGIGGVAKRERYRPGKWQAAPVWFAGPPEPLAAVEAATAKTESHGVRGGASGDW